MIVKNEDKRPRPMQPGVQHTVISYGEQLMLCEVALQADVDVATHAHPHEQVIYVVKGAIQVTTDTQTFVLKTGESCSLASNVPHGVHALQDSLVIDAFSPIREDFLNR